MVALASTMNIVTNVLNVVTNATIWLNMMSLCVYPANIRSCTGFILGEPWIFVKNF